MAVFLYTGSLYAQDNGNSMQNKAVKVYLDKFWMDSQAIKQEISFVNYVQDTRQAEVYILQTSQHTGGGGNEYTFTFVGQGRFTGINDTLKCVTTQDGTQEMRRRKIIGKLKMGLMRYVSRTPYAETISISHRKSRGYKEEALPDDPWDFWVFRLQSRGKLEEEESSKETSVNGSIRASRTTDALKISMNFRTDYSENIYETSDTTTYTSIRRNSSFTGLFVKSITDHWSAGINSKALSDTRVNTDLSIAAGPAIEYNIYPYSISTRKLITFRLGIWGKNINYTEETLYDKTSENLFYSTLSVSSQIVERWGEFSSSIEGNMFFHDTEVNKLDWNTRLNIRLFKGFSLDCGFRTSLIHDQLYLAKGDTDSEEILLRRTQLKTNWKYETWVGFNYTFGSQFSSIVNPRFETRRFRGGR